MKRTRLDMAIHCTEAMRNVLDAIISQTIKARGPNAGEIKNRISGKAYHHNVLFALERRGLIEYRAGTIHGNGWAATEQALEVKI